MLLDRTTFQVENAEIVPDIDPVFDCTIVMTLYLAQLKTFSIQQGYTINTFFHYVKCSFMQYVVSIVVSFC